MAIKCCSKSCEIEVFPPPMVYYKFDALTNIGGTDYQVDSANGHNMTHHTGAGGNYSIVAGHIGNAMQQVQVGSMPYDDVTGVPFDCTEKSWTIRLWFWMSPGNTAHAFDINFNANNYIRILFGYDPAPPNQNTVLEPLIKLSNGIGGTDYFPDNSNPVSHSNWHHYVITFDVTTRSMKMYVDNVFQSAYTFGANYSFRATTFNAIDNLVLGGGCTIKLDEVMFLVGTAWDSTTIALDWNSGAGRTYPF